MKDDFNQAQTPGIANRFAQSASQAIETTQKAADQALDGLDNQVHKLHEQASRGLDNAAQGANAVAQRSAQSVQDATRRLRDTAMQVSDGTTRYVQNEPVKSVLIAAAAGALLMGLFSLLARSGR